MALESGVGVAADAGTGARVGRAARSAVSTTVAVRLDRRQNL